MDKIILSRMDTDFEEIALQLIGGGVFIFGKVRSLFGNESMNVSDVFGVEFVFSFAFGQCYEAALAH